jgi:hypothetical protein
MNGETTRQFDARWDSFTFPENVDRCRSRNKSAAIALQKSLVRGDRLRATKAECGSHEASFIFSHWDRNTIVSKGGSFIAAASVYSVNGVVFRV